jgi:hypothetical protein
MTRGRAARLAQLEEARPVQAVRLVIIRHIVGGGARRDDEELTVTEIVRREVLLYSDGVPRSRRSRWMK